ncbi:MAG: DNA/RNA non-specific endonuclease [Lachnospiraceae bacterium]|nr:DNA/RNA non-specific endonuclease [Lachnospiraceae bacterium]
MTKNFSKINAPEDAISEDTVSPNTENSSNQLGLSQIEDYNGVPYVEINGNVPLFTDEDIKNLEFENYSELDALGRCGVAFACISIDTMPTEERTSIGMIKPSGWHTVKYNDLIDGNYLYNRCHLIGFQLAGENDNEKNLITGTRYLNVEGMLPFENKVSDYVKKTNNHVLYRVTPCFHEDNPLVSGVSIEAYSVEDEGKGICFYVYLYNVQPGIIIDYKTGDSERDSSYAPVGREEVIVEEEPVIAEPEVTNEEASVKYILNTNTHKFHYPTCSSVSEMKEKNKKESNASREEIINQGYAPCKRCNP